MKLSQLIIIIGLLTLLIPQAYSLFHGYSQANSYRLSPSYNHITGLPFGRHYNQQ